VDDRATQCGDLLRFYVEPSGAVGHGGNHCIDAGAHECGCLVLDPVTRVVCHNKDCIMLLRRRFLLAV
jgi:hypothetical protein